MANDVDNRSHTECWITKLASVWFLDDLQGQLLCGRGRLTADLCLSHSNLGGYGWNTNEFLHVFCHLCIVPYVGTSKPITCLKGPLKNVTGLNYICVYIYIYTYIYMYIVEISDRTLQLSYDKRSEDSVQEIISVSSENRKKASEKRTSTSHTCKQLLHILTIGI
jgi:hypothetical protein